MNKQDLWSLFMHTGKIEYYLKYKNYNKDNKDDKESRRNHR